MIRKFRSKAWNSMSQTKTSLKCIKLQLGAPLVHLKELSSGPELGIQTKQKMNVIELNFSPCN